MTPLASRKAKTKAKAAAKPAAKTAKLFTNGGSQAVRLPKEFAFEGTEVLISREGNRVILCSKEKQAKPKTIGELMRHIAAAFPGPSELERPPQPPMPPSPNFDD